jgi:hypothetical protein
MRSMGSTLSRRIAPRWWYQEVVVRADELPMPWRNDLLFSLATLVYVILAIAFAWHFLILYLHPDQDPTSGQRMEQTTWSPGSGASPSPDASLSV